MRRAALSLLACLSLLGVNGRAAEPAKIELMPLKTVTVTEEQFLLGSQDGRPVTLAVELRLPTAVGNSQAKRGSCDLYEQPAWRIMNRQTGRPFTRNDECLRGVGTLGYDARAHAQVIADVTAPSSADIQAATGTIAADARTISFYSESMAPDRSQTDRTAGTVVGLLRRGCWAAVPIGTIESLIAGGRVVDFPSGGTVYAEADAERLAVMMHGLLRVYMHAGDGRQVTVRYVRAGDLLGAPALIGGPAPVFVQAVTHGTAFFFDVDRVKRAARSDASLAWALAEESVHRLYDVLEELAGNTFASVRQRVARHLLDLATSRLDASRTLTALVNQQDLANSVGSVREVVARVLAELRSEHLVRTSPGRVEILDPVRMSQELWSRARDESHSA